MENPNANRLKEESAKDGRKTRHHGKQRRRGHVICQKRGEKGVVNGKGEVKSFSFCQKGAHWVKKDALRSEKERSAVIMEGGKGGGSSVLLKHEGWWGDFLWIGKRTRYQKNR